MERDATDPITPEIEHSIDEVWTDGMLEQRYNFLDYHFEHGTAYLRARSYLDQSQIVTLFGPFERRGGQRGVEAPAAEEAVMTYLSRRFTSVQHR